MAAVLHNVANKNFYVTYTSTYMYMYITILGLNLKKRENAENPPNVIGWWEIPAIAIYL